MNYIILDLEWDSVYVKHISRFMNQILQIGAVKLDENFDVIDVFDVVIKSSVSKRLTKRFTELTGITKEEMLAGVPLEEAVNMYNEWCGEETVTMTWSNSDLFAIDENERNLLNNSIRFKIEKYLDLQKFIQGEMHLLGFELKNQISLLDAADKLGISIEDMRLHNAKDDSLVCAALLKKFYNKERFSSFVKDTSNPEFYNRLRFKAHVISNINDKDIDKAWLEFNCDVCGEKAKRVSKWKYHNRWFSAVFVCSCGRKFNGRLFLKKTFDEVVCHRKICEIKKVRLTESESADSNKRENKRDEMQSVSEKV